MTPWMQESSLKRVQKTLTTLPRFRATPKNKQKKELDNFLESWAQSVETDKVNYIPVSTK